MEALSRQEYPAMLNRLPPAQAVTKLNERVKRIGKVNSEIADWLQERRKVEEAYVAGLKKLARRPLQDVGGELGIFDGPWKKIIGSTEEIANSHTLFASRIEKDVEQPLRNFAANNRGMTDMATTQGNLAAMAKDLEDAQDKSDKLSRKGGKASALKVDAASTRLHIASSSWDSQAPFVFESLQALDERRLNHLRDVLTQYQTHEMDQFERNRKTVEETLNFLLEIETAQEIRNWSAATVAGRPVNERRATRQSSIAASTADGATNNASLPPPPQTPASTHTDNQSEHSGKQEASESKLKSRFGTMLGRRRQSVHGGFGRAPSPSKGGFMPFSRNTASRDGRPSPSPRASSNNLRDSPGPDNRLSSLAESPPPRSPVSQTNGNTNNTNPDTSFIADAIPGRTSSHAPNGSASSNLPDLSDVQPPPGPPPSHVKAAAEAQRDAEGFSVPAPMNDPISQAQQDAALEGEQPQFKLDIRKEPIPEQDADAQAALSNVANTLRSATTPSRKAGTVRGRRDVRNTIFMPSTSNSLDVTSPDNTYPPSPGIATGRAAALAALSSGDHHTAPSTSDTTSIRSGHSLTNHAAVKHVETHEPGLNASIIETVSVTFGNGVVKTAKINGEIALIHNATNDVSSSSNETIRINNFPNLEAISQDRTFIQQVSAEKPDEYTIDLASISSKSSVAFTYRVHIDEANVTTQGPLLIKNSWKQQADKLGLIVEYSLNPAFGSEPVTFNNLVLVGIYQGARAAGCQTKPTGTHLKEKSLVYWRLGDVTLGPETHKLVCRFSGVDGAVPEPGHIEARWEINSPSNSPIGSGISISKLEPSKGKGREENDDPFADESVTSPTTATPLGTWSEIGMHKKLVSGKYEAR